MPMAATRKPPHISTRGETRVSSRPATWVEPITSPTTIGRSTKPVTNGGEPFDRLQIVSKEQKHPEHAHHGQAESEAHPASVAFGDHPQRQQRVAHLGLHHDEQDQ
ncbi:hypothetical protein GCM10022402_28240 [Salinactinospora qingdaonensis]|uniref:Uncharacterized protein n=1 Tax=Salinactinospora qingdaonensis TaxID=702744 RepID=A0ABP7FSH2_9ACTN